MKRFPRALLIGLTIAGSPAMTRAMPPFAQAYSVDCSVCHTQVPALNTHGRYVQRTGYDVLDHTILKRSLPVWIGVSPSYDTQASPRVQMGNVAVHAVGVSGDFSYHIQQWIVQNNAAGSLDTAWIAYNGLLRHSGHLFLGKIEAPAPSPFSQWFDLSSFAAAQMKVGEHAYQLGANRWGAKFAYVHGRTDAEVAWLGANTGLEGSNQFTQATDKTLQWKLAHAVDGNPLEAGFFGSRGSFPLSEGGVDRYGSVAAYVQRDPRKNVPGVLAIYQRTYDANPGNGAPAAAGIAQSLELYQRFFGARALIGVRKELTNDGLGTLSQSGNVDFEYHLIRFVHVYAESYFAQNSKPGYRAMLWWTAPLR